jgi:3-vinyl bacteriochlorophyllide hydratase
LNYAALNSTPPSAPKIPAREFGSSKGAGGGDARTRRMSSDRSSNRQAKPLYTVEQRLRRDQSIWTMVQGFLAPVQFLVFLISLALVLRYLASGEGETVAALSVVVKTLALYAIMITGAIWEKVVFGRYLFAPAFFWEDVFSMLVLALHTAYLAALAFGWLNPRALMILALAAYASYAINATQFILKLRAARLQSARSSSVAQQPQLEGAR